MIQNWFRKLREFFTPRTAMGFLYCGWFGGAFVMSLMPIFPGLWGLIPVTVVYVPMFFLADRARVKQIKITKFLADLENQIDLHEEEKNIES